MNLAANIFSWRYPKTSGEGVPLGKVYLGGENVDLI